MISYRITHVTTYDYAEPVSLCQNVAHLVPRTASGQQVGKSALAISPEPAAVDARTDYFGNAVHYFTIQEPHRKLVVRADHEVALDPRTPPAAADTPPWEAVRDRLHADRSAGWLDASQFTCESLFVRTDPRYAAYAEPSFTPGRPILAAALDLTSRIHREFAYDPRATNVATPVSEVFANRRGVCQDFAHFQLACLRSLGLAARYVSGYLATVPAPGKPRLVGADASHAWVSVWCGEAGWVDFDPTNDVIPSGRHILVAWGRDYEDVSPLKGVILGGGKHAVRVEVDVR